MKKEKSCGCIIFDNGKVLLIQHKEGHWGFPKGHVEENETEKETAIREVKEETNLDVEIIFEKRYVENYIINEDIDKTVVYFFARKIGGELKKQDSELNDIAWVNVDEVPDKLTFDVSRNVFKELLKDLD